MLLFYFISLTHKFLPKGLALGRDENIHIRITPLGDVGSHNPPPLGARRPRRHTSG